MRLPHKGRMGGAKMKKRLIYISLLTVAGVLVCCFAVWLFIVNIPFLNALSDLIPKENRCLSSLPSPDFSEADLVGTWWAGYASYPKRSDTLVIREDGTYKQTIHLDVPTVDYESDWQRWWLEYHTSGIPYLHLEGMRFCAINPSFNCNDPTGHMVWYDFCEDTSIAMDNEGILIVLGKTLDFPMGSENSWFYHRQVP